jgi:hypothetical protein
MFGGKISAIMIRQLAAQYPESLILIGHHILLPRAQRIQQHYPTIALKADATAKDLLIENWQ